MSVESIKCYARLSKYCIGKLNLQRARSSISIIIVLIIINVITVTVIYIVIVISIIVAIIIAIAIIIILSLSLPSSFPWSITPLLPFSAIIITIFIATVIAIPIIAIAIAIAIFHYTIKSVKLAFWLVQRSVWLEYRRTIDVIEWCDQRTWSESRVQLEWLVNKVLQTVFASSGQTLVKANFRRKGNLFDEKFYKCRWEWP